ncbi:MAG: putative hemolysin [Ascidiaceihabitans sp.]|jgi:putative hemolysin
MDHFKHQAMMAFNKGRYSAAMAVTAQDVAAAQALRGLCFDLSDKDIDLFDAACAHVLIRCVEDNSLVACFRMLSLDGDTIGASYSAQYYALDALADFKGRMVELGRFCIHPDRQDPDILRVAWAAMTAYVDQNDVKLLFGCTSFAGTETSKYDDAFAMLRDHHIAPKRWLPKIKAPDVFKYAAKLQHKPDIKKAMLRMPPLLRTYLLMGGWVSDHAVVDRQLNTMHVFTGVEIGMIPAARKRLLRAVIG